MPELPEVETVVRGLGPKLKGARISSFELLHSPLLRRPADPPGLAFFAGKKIQGVRRRGKMILIECRGGGLLIFHLKMTGQLLFVRPNTPPDRHTRLVISLAMGKAELHFRDVRKFGFLCLSGYPLCPLPPELSNLGPEPLDLDGQSFRELFRRRKGRIKSLLLDQNVIAGIGNIYADEMLFGAGIHPLTSARSLGKEKLESLWRAMRAVLRKAIVRKGSSIRNFTDAEGRPGNFQLLHHVYGREDEECRRCGTLIRRIKIGGRSAFFCPSCQKRRRLESHNQKGLL